MTGLQQMTQFVNHDMLHTIEAGMEVRPKDNRRKMRFIQT